jgi:hypothetical protein
MARCKVAAQPSLLRRAHSAGFYVLGYNKIDRRDHLLVVNTLQECQRATDPLYGSPWGVFRRSLPRSDPRTSPPPNHFGDLRQDSCTFVLKACSLLTPLVCRRETYMIWIRCPFVRNSFYVCFSGSAKSRS